MPDTAVSVDGFRAASPAVFESDADPVVVGPGQIRRLVEAARRAPAGRSRLLLHPDRADGLHEMVIALPSDSFDHPHINFRSGKSFLALSGRFAVLLFSGSGEFAQPIVLSAGSWPGARLTRLRTPVWHTIVPLEGDTVFLETIAGPFEGNRFAPWFPARGSEDGAAFVASARRFVAASVDRRW